MRAHPERDDFLARVFDLPQNWITPFKAELFRFIDPQFSAAEDIISGDGGLYASGRWHQKGAMRVAYAATEPETALAESLAHARYYNLPLSTALPRVLVSLGLNAISVLDLRNHHLRSVLQISANAGEVTARVLLDEFKRSMTAVQVEAGESLSGNLQAKLRQGTRAMASYKDERP